MKHDNWEDAIQRDFVKTNALVFLCTVLIGIAPIVFSSDSPDSKAINQAIQLAFITFAVLQLLVISHRQYHFLRGMREAGERLESKEALFQLIARLDEDVAEARDGLLSDDFIQASVSSAAFKALSQYSVSGDLAEIENEYLTIEFYREFWAKVVRLQEARSRHSRRKPLIINTTHSASILLWGRAEFSQIRAYQRRFLELGGLVNRVLINQSGGLEKATDYSSTLDEIGCDDMGGMNTFYIERTSRENAIDDFLLTVVDDTKYSFVWETSWRGDYGAIMKCKIHRGAEPFQTYWDRWCIIVSECHNWAPPEGIVDKRLTRRPTIDEVKMLTARP